MLIDTAVIWNSQNNMLQDRVRQRKSFGELYKDMATKSNSKIASSIHSNETLGGVYESIAFAMFQLSRNLWRSSLGI